MIGDLSCPCGARRYDACCGPLHRGEREAPTPEALMRARYAAYALGESDYVFRTWHPRTRPEDVAGDPGLRWTGLEVLATTGGGAGEDSGEVEFRASYDVGGVPGVLHERSRFSRRAGRWVYVDGELDPTQ